MDGWLLLQVGIGCLDHSCNVVVCAGPLVQLEDGRLVAVVPPPGQQVGHWLCPVMFIIFQKIKLVS